MKNFTKLYKKFRDLADRKTNPAGKFDQAGRFYLDQKFDCCRGLRSPSRAFPYSEMVHGRTSIHVAFAADCSQSEVFNFRKFCRKQAALKIQADRQEKLNRDYFKKMAWDGSRLVSIFSGEIFEIGKTYTEANHGNHEGGYYFRETVAGAQSQGFPESSLVKDLPLVIVRCRLAGVVRDFGDKINASTFVPLEIISGLHHAMAVLA